MRSEKICSFRACSERIKLREHKLQESYDNLRECTRNRETTSDKRVVLAVLPAAPYVCACPHMRSKTHAHIKFICVLYVLKIQDHWC
jgi:hypothetical protein